MQNVINIQVAKDERKIVEYLTDLLAEAKAGNVTEFVICHKDKDGKWYNSCSGSANFHEAAGKLFDMAIHRLGYQLR